MKLLAILSVVLTFAPVCLADANADAEIREVCILDGKSAGLDGAELNSFITACENNYSSIEEYSYSDDDESSGAEYEDESVDSSPVDSDVAYDGVLDDDVADHDIDTEGSVVMDMD